MKKYYKFSDVELELDISQSEFYGTEEPLKSFSVEKVKNPYYFRFIFVDNFDAPIGEEIATYPNYSVYKNGNELQRFVGSLESGCKNAYMKIIYNGKNHLVLLKKSVYPNGIGVKTVLTALGTEHLIAESGGFILHASFIEWHSKGILFTGPSGIGKSTQAKLWKIHRNVEIINGDRVAIGLHDGKFYAYGIPYSGSAKHCINKSLPIAAIVCLKQSEINNIKKLNGKKGFSKIFSECTVNTWNQKELESVRDLVCQLITSVPIYQLSCTADVASVLVLENKLYGGEIK